VSKSKNKATIPSADRRAKILEIARKLLVKAGIGGVTYAAIAARLRVSKQAIIYWFPSKEALIRELAIENFEAEAEAIEAAMSAVADPTQAIPTFVRACLDHHRAHLETFRLMYLFPQLQPETSKFMPLEYRQERLYPVTGRIYTSLERHLERTLPRDESARTLAVAVHSAAIGLACMASLMDACDDAMKESVDAYAASLSRALSSRRVVPRTTTPKTRSK
jgi:AcrR family transcriptional regulator